MAVSLPPSSTKERTVSARKLFFQPEGESGEPALIIDGRAA